MERNKREERICKNAGRELRMKIIFNNVYKA